MRALGSETLSGAFCMDTRRIPVIIRSLESLVIRFDDPFHGTEEIPCSPKFR